MCRPSGKCLPRIFALRSVRRERRRKRRQSGAPPPATVLDDCCCSDSSDCGSEIDGSAPDDAERRLRSLRTRVEYQLVEGQRLLLLAEETYFEETHQHGNIFRPTGAGGGPWADLLDGRLPGVQDGPPVTRRAMPEQYRWFSGSSFSVPGAAAGDVPNTASVVEVAATAATAAGERQIRERDRREAEVRRVRNPSSVAAPSSARSKSHKNRGGQRSALSVPVSAPLPIPTPVPPIAPAPVQVAPPKLAPLIPAPVAPPVAVGSPPLTHPGQTAVVEVPAMTDQELIAAFLPDDMFGGPEDQDAHLFMNAEEHVVGTSYMAPHAAPQPVPGPATAPFLKKKSRPTPSLSRAEQTRPPRPPVYAPGQNLQYAHPGSPVLVQRGQEAPWSPASVSVGGLTPTPIAALTPRGERSLAAAAELVAGSLLSPSTPAAMMLGRGSGAPPVSTGHGGGDPLSVTLDPGLDSADPSAFFLPPGSGDPDMMFFDSEAPGADGDSVDAMLADLSEELAAGGSAGDDDMEPTAVSEMMGQGGVVVSPFLPLVSTGPVPVVPTDPRAKDGKGTKKGSKGKTSTSKKRKGSGS